MSSNDQSERRRMHEQNRRSWNAVTPAHNSHKLAQAEFFGAGGSTLFPEETELLGDLSEADLVHLQCNCGQDTLSLARLARSALGVDIADEAVSFATGLSRRSGIEARFVLDDVLDWCASTELRFDVAFASYGTLGWLADIGEWARGVERILRPGGRLVLLEFHPLVWSLGREGLTGDSYFLAGPIEEAKGVNDYVGEALAPSGFQPAEGPFQNPIPAVSFQWTVADIVQSVADAGLRIETLREYPYANGCELFEGMRRVEGNRYVLPDGMPQLPLMLGLTARKKAH